MDVGKYKTYGVVEKDGKQTKERYFPTTKEGIASFLEGVQETTVVLEASSTVDRVASFIEKDGIELRVANPLKLRMLPLSMKKTDKNDAHTILDLYKKTYLPESYFPPKEIRESRNLCRSRSFLVRQRTALKNKIRDLAYRLGIDFRSFNKANIEMLKNVNTISATLCRQLESLSMAVSEADAQIHLEFEKDHNAGLINTIIGIGENSALAISSEIGDVSRFLNEDGLFAYAGLSPRLFQSGNKEWKGHISNGNSFLKWVLIECAIVHLKFAHSSLVEDYHRIAFRCGKKKARIALARRMLRAIYYMLKRDQDFDSYERERRCVVRKHAALQR